ncbi:hypothetical protein EDD29_0415 [Actinocorallia herbida]|uniref:Uncharacterized protein n=1 Tax=Actinocorallia herbida TaxID=58109 RepID=A0A3N1CNN5_9ACTN|nr:hypothetical protein [Actinocorallia herbida]ROO82929.1 hypothetical protein EDD29_0415 [Actinocorallia herbida]
MSGSLLNIAFFAVPAILLPVLIVAFYFAEPSGRPESGDRWRSRY